MTTLPSPGGIRVQFTLPSDPRYLQVVRGTVAALSAVIGWDESECRRITLAIDEAITNVIRHGYHSRLDGVINLECQQLSDGLQVTMRDNGDPPDSSKICAREIGGDQPGGLGTHIIREVMDSVSYQKSGTENLFVATKLIRRSV